MVTLQKSLTELRVSMGKQVKLSQSINKVRFTLLKLGSPALQSPFSFSPLSLPVTPL